MAFKVADKVEEVYYLLLLLYIMEGQDEFIYCVIITEMRLVYVYL